MLHHGLQETHKSSIIVPQKMVRSRILEPRDSEDRFDPDFSAD
jgi:hypothetical protein